MLEGPQGTLLLVSRWVYMGLFVGRVDLVRVVVDRV
jgi:hypothetical protein